MWCWLSDSKHRGGWGRGRKWFLDGETVLVFFKKLLKHNETCLFTCVYAKAEDPHKLHHQKSPCTWNNLIHADRQTHASSPKIRSYIGSHTQTHTQSFIILLNHLIPDLVVYQSIYLWSCTSLVYFYPFSSPLSFPSFTPPSRLSFSSHSWSLTPVMGRIEVFFKKYNNAGSSCPGSQVLS